jgi:hypothetical protein
MYPPAGLARTGAAGLGRAAHDAPERAAEVAALLRGATLAAHPCLLEAAAVTGGHQRIQHGMGPLGAGEPRVGPVERDDVGIGADLDGADRLAKRRRAAARQPAPQRRAQAIGVRETATAPGQQPLAVLQPAQLLGRVDAHVAVGAQREAPARGRKLGRREQAVAQVGLGQRAEHHRRAAGENHRALRGVRMGGVHQAPVGPELDRLGQQVHGPAPGGGQAGRHLRGLLGDVDMHRAVRAQQLARAERHVGEHAGGHGAQRVRGHAGAVVGVHRHQRQEVFHVAVQEARLPRARGRIEAAALVEHRDERQADAGVGRGANHRLDELRRALAVGASMQVVELGHRSEPGGQHVAIGPPGHLVERVGVEPGRQPVHGLAPAPETVLAACCLAVTGQPALEGVAVRARHAGERQPAVEGAGRVARCDRADAARAIDFQLTVALNAGRRENMLEIQGALHRFIRRPDRPLHARAVFSQRESLPEGRRRRGRRLLCRGAGTDRFHRRACGRGA